MRLLKINDDGSLSLTKFQPNDIPNYAILSHTWLADNEEVNFQEMVDGTGRSKAGYRKIQFCREQAKKDGLRYFWVDSCCIDKSSSSELSEAINSMFKWYRNAYKAYVYLSDVSANDWDDNNLFSDDHDDSTSCLPTQPSENLQRCLQRSAPQSSYSWEGAFRTSKWFTRGWTLQELLAPRVVEFFDKDGHYLGSKKQRMDLISEITGISLDALSGSALSNFSVAQKMSWAACRETTVPEDRAYCILGIFDIHMPLLYGEGASKAFLRLQEEILKKSDDHSLFAWRMQPRYAAHGLLALSPAAFKHSQHFIPCNGSGRKSPYSSTNQGLQIRLPISGNTRNGLHTAILNCVDERTGNRLALKLKQIGLNSFIRTRLDQLTSAGPRRSLREFQPFEMKEILVPQLELSPYRPRRSLKTYRRLGVSATLARLPYHAPRIPANPTIAACGRCLRCPARIWLCL